MDRIGSGVNFRKKSPNDVVNDLKLEADYAQKAINCPKMNNKNVP